MRLSIRFCLALLVIPTLTLSQHSIAQDNNALAQCRAQSLELDRIHACMDSYLDVMDGNIRAITNFLNNSLTGNALQGLSLSQQAFVEYRRQNCLWYLEFPAPREEAEQIAKNCLANMSRQRLEELQDLVTVDNDSGRTAEGFYVYGAERNSFQPCGGEERYWIEGDSGAVGLVQQTYLSVASNDLQLLHVTLAGNILAGAQAPDGHAGVFQLDGLIEMRFPTESDCRLPGRPFNADLSVAGGIAQTATSDIIDDQLEPQDEPEQQLTAYFGAWIVDCVEFSGSKTCTVEVALMKNNEDQSVTDRVRPRLIVNRLPGAKTSLELDFPSREIDSPKLIRWQIDNQSFGDIVGSEIRVDQISARQLVNEGGFVDNELLPAMIQGNKVNIDVLRSADDASGEVFNATLKGLTKALEFADGFLRENG